MTPLTAALFAIFLVSSLLFAGWHLRNAWADRQRYRLPPATRRELARQRKRLRLALPRMRVVRR